ncbi:hypothetical protein G9F72_010730 [Clostridium estertheticum]|uniref:hypothetical protein n=1 Tax=Clostridium estertheticum TaxID=238834 RepID=UPI0013E966C5|nr:hypothetical protein [Clostridium estertheticum]MBZ9686799.1 hypothetical protein [Clostridium estertheticum]
MEDNQIKSQEYTLPFAVHSGYSFGGSAPQHLYGYTTTLILNKDSQVELIQLETD